MHIFQQMEQVEQLMFLIFVSFETTDNEQLNHGTALYSFVVLIGMIGCQLYIMQQRDNIVTEVSQKDSSSQIFLKKIQNI